MTDPLDTYLRLIFPWDDEHKDLYKSIMHSFIPRVPTPGKTDAKVNTAAQSYEDLRRLIALKNKPNQNMWICLGTQKFVDAKVYRDGFHKAQRQFSNIVSLRSLWIDIDVKHDGYKTTGEAASAVASFVQAAGLPQPTMFVFSGSGGMHVYWCSDVPMPVNDWEVLAKALQTAAIAHGLKFDPQVTVNRVGVLRVPTTINWKGDPRPVQLLETPSYPTYTYAELKTALSTYIGVANIGMSQAQRGATSGIHQNFTAGVTNQVPPVPLADIAAACPLVTDTIARGGNGDTEPHWNHMMLLASFTDDPPTSAHELSKGDPRYSAQETLQKVTDKLTARSHNPNIGWPKCRQFALNGNPHCAACPLLVQDKSPFNFVSSAAPQQKPATDQPDFLPAGYFVGKDGGWIYADTIDKQGNPGQELLLRNPLLEAGIDPDRNVLAFKTVIMAQECWAELNTNCVNNLGTLLKALGSAPRGGIHPSPRAYEQVRKFFVAWIDHLQRQHVQKAVSTYGWSDDMKSFTFGSKTFTPKGDEPSYLGKSFNHHYKETGDIKPWHAAMQLVYGKPELEILVASSFAAPLVQLQGSTSAILSVVSAASGVGKSTAMKLAQAAWGHPTTGMSSLDDTINSVKKKIADLKSLPAYWDELITADATNKVVELVFSFTQGKAKSRLTQNSEQMDTNSFVTMFAIASNHGISSKVYSDTSGTEAGGLRIFEVEASSYPSTFTLGQAGLLMGALDTNFGKAGAQFADRMMRDLPMVRKLLKDTGAMFDRYFQFDVKERYWRTTMIAVFAGARLANQFIGTTFDMQALLARLESEFKRQRARLRSKSHVTMTSPHAATDMLEELRLELHGRHLLTTEVIHVGAGRPPVNKPVDMNTLTMSDVWMQVGVNDKRVLVVSNKFITWLYERHQNPDNIKHLLEKDYDVRIDRFTLGAGVAGFNTNGVGKTMCWLLTPLPPTSSGSNPGV